MVETVAKKQDFLEPKSNQVLKARQNLREVLQKKLEGNMSIYDHVVKVVDRIVQSCPDSAIERFEEISYLIKSSDSLNLEDFVRCSDQRDYSKHCAVTSNGTKDAIE